MKMGLQELHASLRGGGGPVPTGEEFFDLLRAPDDATFSRFPSQSAWEWARVQLFSVRMEEFTDAAEPSEAFAARLREDFQIASKFLAACSLEGVNRWRALGRNCDVFLGGWLANEQFDLEIPAIFLEQCARLNIAINICTND